MKLPPFPRWCMTSLSTFSSLHYLIFLLICCRLFFCHHSLTCALSLPPLNDSFVSTLNFPVMNRTKSLLTLFPTCVSVLLNPVSNLFVLRRGHWIYHRRCISKSSSNSGDLGMGSQSFLDMPWIFIVPVLFHMFRMLHTIR